MFRNAAWMRLMEICREPEGTGTGTGTGSETSTRSSRRDDDDDDDDSDGDPRQSWKDYALSLRKQSSRYRRERNDFRDKVTAAEAAKVKVENDLADLRKKYDTDVAKAAKEAKDAADATIAKATKDTNARLVTAEVRAQAMKEGVSADRLDDLLKLIDVSGITVDDAGHVKGADALIADAKKSKPYLFGSASTSATEKPPEKKPVEGKLAKDFSDDEWKAGLKNLGINSLR